MYYQGPSRHLDPIRALIQRKPQDKDTFPRTPYRNVWPLASPLAKCGGVSISPRDSGGTLFSSSRTDAAEHTRRLLWGPPAAPEAQRFRTPLARPLGSLLSRDVSLDAMRKRASSRHSLPHRLSATPPPRPTTSHEGEGGGRAGEARRLFSDVSLQVGGGP